MAPVLDKRRLEVDSDLLSILAVLSTRVLDTRPAFVCLWIL